MRIADLEARITANTSGFEKGVNRSRDELGRFTKGLKDGGDSVGKFSGMLQVFAGNMLTSVVGALVQATKAVAAFGDECADAASDVNESVSKINTLFGKSAAEVDKWSKSTASSMGLSRRASLEAAGNYGNLFRAMQFGEQQSAQFSTRLVQMAADFSSFNNTSLEQALDAIRSGLVGESEPLRAFGVMLSETALKQEALKMHLVSTTKDALTPQTKALATMSLMTKQTAAAQGDFAKTAAGAANAQRILSARFEDFKTKIGELTLPLKAQAIAGLNSLMETLNRIDFKAVLAAFQAFFAEIGSGIKERVKPATDFFLSLWKQVVTWFQQNLPLIQRTVQTVVGFITKFWHDHGQQILAIVTTIWNQVKNRIQTALDIVLGLVKAAMQLITGDWQGMAESLGGVVKNLFKFLVDTFKTLGTLLVQSLKFILSTLYDLLARVFSTIGNGLMNGLSALGSWIGQAFVNAIGNAFGERAKELAIRIGGWVGAVAEAARKQLLSVLPGGGSAPVMPSVSGPSPGMGDLHAAEARESAKSPWDRMIEGVRRGLSGGTSGAKVTMPGMPSMGSLISGVKPTDALAGDGDDKAAKKAKKDRERHAKEVLDARQDLADKIAGITLSEWDQQRRELNKFIGEYKKKTGDLVGARKYFALESARITGEQVKAEMAVMDQWLEQGRKESEEFAKEQEAILRRFLQNVARLPILTSDIAAREMMASAEQQAGAAMGERVAGTGVKGLKPTIMGKVTTPKEQAAAQSKRITDGLRDQFSNVTGEGFLDSLAGGKSGIKRFWADVVTDGRQALLKLGWSEVIQPQLKGLFASLKEGLNGSLQGIVGAAGTIINAAYGLLSAMGANGKKRQFGSIIGGVLGGIAAIATGGAALPFISAGMSLGGAFAGGNVGEILMAGLSTASSFGAFSTGKTATGTGNALPDGANLDARFKGINVTQNIYGGVNNAADLASVNTALGGNLESALRVP